MSATDDVLSSVRQQVLRGALFAWGLSFFSRCHNWTPRTTGVCWTGFAQ